MTKKNKNKKPSAARSQMQASGEEKRREPEQEQSAEDLFHVVAIGASAGGIAALKNFLTHVPGNSGLAFVIILHLSPEHESHLAEILQAHTSMVVKQAEQSVPIERNHVYIIPPNANLEAIDSHLHLTDLEDRGGGRAPIDHFFRTLSESHGPHAIGVVLTGSGFDGTLGLRQIKERDGLTIVQNPDEAEYDGMPRSAVAAASVDLMLPLAEIPDAIMRFTQTKPLLEVPADADDSDSQLQQDSQAQQFKKKVFAQVRARTGRDFTHYKPSTMLRRIARRMQAKQIRQPNAYLELLREHPEETQTLADDLLITVTSFFRDPEVFDMVAQKVIPRLFENRGADNTIRMWSVGCATGEEAYSLAILLAEEARRCDHPPILQVFATDLHDQSLQFAREGLFPGEIVADVSPERLKRFFERENGGYRIRRELRELVLFAPHNLLADPPFSKLDLISCRNLLIYLNRDLHKQVAELFHYALNPRGFLFLGTSESMEVNDLFRVEDKNKRLYRKRDVPGPEPSLPVFPMIKGRVPYKSLPVKQQQTPLQHSTLQQRIIAQNSPPSLLLGPDDTVLHVSGRAGRYLVQPEGPITASVFKLVRDELRIELHATISEARRSKKEMVTKSVSVRFNGETAAVVLHVKPALDEGQEGFVVVQFAEGPDLRDRRRPSGEERGENQESEAAEDTKEHSKIEELQADKRVLEERLRQSIEERGAGQEELKAANEELMSANEELRSTLEELETSKEELQSINEELQTVNQENRHKVEELAQLSSDLQNLLVATDIGTLFLDRELRILRFTPKVEELFNIRSTDRGRPISDFTGKLGYDTLESDGHKVLESLVPIEQEVEDGGGRWYLIRVLPYRTPEDRIAGVVITFVEISRQKKAEEDMRQAKRAAERIIESLPQPLLVLHKDLTVYSANAAFYDYFQVTSEEIIGYPLPTLGNRQWNHPELRKLLEDIIPNNRSFDDYLIKHEFERIGQRSVLLNGRQLVGMNLILLGIYDITARHEMEQDLRRSEERLSEENRHKDEYLAMLGHELRNPLGALCNATELLQRTPTEDTRLGKVYGVLNRQTAHMSRIIDGLLDVSRIARGKITLDTRPVKVGEVLERVFEVRKPQLSARGLELKTDFTPEPLWINGDVARLTQIFDNILGNALKFTNSPGKITVVLTREDSSAVVWIRDTGSGISKEMLMRLFDPFHQEAQDPARSAGGLGLGLALAKGLVELHYGTITADSAGVGQGAEFEVRLPLTSVPDEIAQEPDTTEVCCRRVLIVEDNADAANMLSNLLEVDGHEVTITTNGSEALEILGKIDIDIVLCDIGLPGMSGYELAQTIRGDSSLRKLLLIAVTGYGQPEDRRKTAEAGFDDHLVKPVDTDELNRVLSRLDNRDERG